MIFNDKGVRGPDVSFYQDAPHTSQGVDFVKMRAAGAQYVIIKAGQRDYPDPDFIYNWNMAKAARIPRSSYWFYDSRADPKAQANKWWSLIQNDPGELMHFLDLEEDYRGAWRNWQYWYDCLFEFQKLSGLPWEKIGVYTGYFYWIEHAPTSPSNLAWFKRCPLWLASYGSVASARVPEPWTECLFWQYGTPPVGLEYGAESIELDMNLFNGSLEAFQSRFNLTETLPPSDGEAPTQPGATMSRYEATSIYNMSRRPEPDVDNAPIGASVPAGVTMYGDELVGEQGSGSCWLKLTRYGSTVVSDAQYVAVEHANRIYCQLTDNEPDEPPAEEPVHPVSGEMTLTLSDGTTQRYAIGQITKVS